MNSSTYIILNTAGVGGAEKRFTDNWHQLLQDFGLDIHLVIGKQTHSGLMRQSGYAEKLASSQNLHVLDLGDGGFKPYCKAVNAFLATRPKGGVVHFPISAVPRIRQRFGHKVVVSWVNSAMPPFSRTRWKIGVGAWWGLLSADRVDVLNPDNLAKMSKFPGMAKKLTLTAGGTRIDSDLYRMGQKTANFVFLGRIEPEKQCLRFVECLPQLHHKLQQAGHTGYRFMICGDGSDAPALRALLSQPSFNDLPVEFGFSAHPEKVLGSASVYFSLQRTSNYPSKALAEAMACGAFPILTQVGESQLMVEGCPGYAFVPKEFAANDLFLAMQSFLTIPKQQSIMLAEEIAQFAKRRFAPEVQAAYFADIYRSLGGQQ